MSEYLGGSYDDLQDPANGYQSFWLGDQGPFFVNPSDEYITTVDDDPDNLTADSTTLRAMRGSQILIEDAPANADEAVRLQDLNTNLDTTSHRLASVTGIDATAVATTSLLTAPYDLVVDRIVFVATAVSAFVSEATAGVGVAAGEDDILQPWPLTGLDSTGKVIILDIKGLAAKVSSGSGIKLGVDTGAGAGTYTLRVDLFGYRL